LTVNELLSYTQRIMFLRIQRKHKIYRVDGWLKRTPTISIIDFTVDLGLSKDKKRSMCKNDDVRGDTGFSF